MRFIYIVCGFGAVLFLLMTYKKKILVSGRAFLYALYVVFFLVLYAMLGNVSLSLIASRTTYFLLIFINFYVLAYQIWDYERCFKLYKKICLFVSALIIIQFVLGHLGIGISLIPAGVTTNTAGQISSNVYRTNQLLDGRFSTFFLEPAHQAQYCMPCLALVLFSGLNTDKRTIIPAIILTAGLLTTTSMQGILGAGVIWAIYLVVMIKEERIKRTVGRLLLLVPLIVISVYFLGTQPVLREQFQKKIMSFNGGNIYRGTSLYVRMIYGWDCYKEMGILQKIFGYGYSNSGTYLLSSGIGLRYTSRELIGYMSGMSKMFCELGIVGVLLNFRVMVFPLLRKPKAHRDLKLIGLIASITVIMLTSAAFDSISSLLPITFALSIYLNNTSN